MPKKLSFTRRSEDEDIKQSGLFLDFDELGAKGALGGADANIAKWYGVYKSRQPGNHMARIVVPGGVITCAQARNIADISEKYGQGIVNVTTRQALQFHWLKVGALADVLRELQTKGNTTLHGCGDVTRNVAACPLAETCPHRRLDARKWAKKTARLLTDSRDLDDLPRKYKVTFSGCRADCAQPHINCAGFSGVTFAGEPGFRVVIGGGMGWKPFVAQRLFGFVPEQDAPKVARAVALLFRDHGDRYNRAKSRLKFVVHRKGIDFCRQVVEGHLRDMGVNLDAYRVDDVVDEGTPFPERPLTEDTPLGTDGTHVVRVLVPKGELSFTSFLQLAELAEEYGDQRLYTTNRQNLEIHGVEPRWVSTVEARVQELGFATRGSFSLSDIVSCVGTTYCPKAVTRTRDLYDLVAQVVAAPRFADIAKAGFINITGCPNSCSPYRIADIGFRGMRIREEEGSVEGYEVLLGGTQTSFGRTLGAFKIQDCPAVLTAVLDAFLQLRQGDETLAACVARVGIEPFHKAVFQ